MIPGNYSITLTIGTTFDPIVFQFSEGIIPGDDITGWDFTAEVRTIPGGTVMLNLAPTVTDGPNRIITTDGFTDEETALLVAATHKWDLIGESPGGEIRGRYLAGSFSFVPKISLSS